MPLPDTLEKYAIRCLHRYEKKLEQKDQELADLRKKVTDYDHIIRMLQPVYSSDGSYVTFQHSYPDVGSALYQLLRDNNFIPEPPNTTPQGNNGE